METIFSMILFNSFELIFFGIQFNLPHKYKQIRYDLNGGGGEGLDLLW